MSHSVGRVIDDAIAQKSIVGAEIVVAKAGKVIYRRAAGHFDREAGIAMPENAIYRLASVTKPIVAATALAMVDKGLLKLSDRVDSYLPYFQPLLDDGSVAQITLHHLLTHTAGLAYGYPEDAAITTGLGNTDLDHEANLTRVASQKLLFKPGTAWSYSFSIDVLGAVLARVHGGTLEDAVRAYVTGPLDMNETGFFIADPTRLAPAYADGKPEPVPMEDTHVVIGEDGDGVLFSPIRIFNEKAFQSGGAGMAGTPSDLLKLFEALRLGGGGILRPETVALATRNQIGDLPRDAEGMRFGYLSAIVDDPVAADTPAPVGSYNWGGVYGHSWLVDPTNELVMLSISNTALEGCTGAFPTNVRNAVYADFVR